MGILFFVYHTPSLLINPKEMTITPQDDLLYIANKSFSSRLMLGTGKYRNLTEAKKSIEASGCEILTVALFYYLRKYPKNIRLLHNFL